MEITWDATYIDLNNLLGIARGEKAKTQKYLVQFKELIPVRIQMIKTHLQTQDRKKIRQTLHQLSPQLQFFGIPGVLPFIQRLAREYQTIPWEELEPTVENVLIKLNDAHQEALKILDQYFSEN